MQRYSDKEIQNDIVMAMILIMTPITPMTMERKRHTIMLTIQAYAATSKNSAKAAPSIGKEHWHGQDPKAPRKKVGPVENIANFPWMSCWLGDSNG